MELRQGLYLSALSTGLALLASSLTKRVYEPICHMPAASSVCPLRALGVENTGRLRSRTWRDRVAGQIA